MHLMHWDKRETLMYSPNLMSFFQCLQDIQHSQHPTLVNSICELNVSANLFILVDICIQQARQDGFVGIRNQIQKLRLQLPNFIDIPEDYFVAHLILMRYISFVKRNTRNFSLFNNS